LSLTFVDLDFPSVLQMLTDRRAILSLFTLVD